MDQIKVIADIAWAATGRLGWWWRWFIIAIESYSLDDVDRHQGSRVRNPVAIVSVGDLKAQAFSRAPRDYSSSCDSDCSTADPPGYVSPRGPASKRI